MSDDREQRILDAAAELIAHYGYDKTTVSDIAREAGISKGAIYLHFASKDDLFEQLLRREMMRYSEDWMQHIQDDPQGGTIGGIYRNSLRALNANPFMAALFRQDQRVLGSYLRQPDNLFVAQGTGLRREFIAMMQEAGAVRDDISPDVAAHIMNIFAYGLVGVGDVLDDEEMPSFDATLNAIGDFMDRALTPDDGGNPDAAKAIIIRLTRHAQQNLSADNDNDDDAL